MQSGCNLCESNIIRLPEMIIKLGSSVNLRPFLEMRPWSKWVSPMLLWQHRLAAEESASLALSSFTSSINQLSKLQTSNCHWQALPHEHVLRYCPERWKINARYCFPSGVWWKLWKEHHHKLSLQISADIINRFFWIKMGLYFSKDTRKPLCGSIQWRVSKVKQALPKSPQCKVQFWLDPYSCLEAGRKH